MNEQVSEGQTFQQDCEEWHGAASGKKENVEVRAVHRITIHCF